MMRVPLITIGERGTLPESSLRDYSTSSITELYACRLDDGTAVGNLSQQEERPLQLRVEFDPPDNRHTLVQIVARHTMHARKFAVKQPSPDPLQRHSPFRCCLDVSCRCRFPMWYRRLLSAPSAPLCVRAMELPTLRYPLEESHLHQRPVVLLRARQCPRPAPLPAMNIRRLWK